jgi:hypothetical protein
VIAALGFGGGAGNKGEGEKDEKQVGPHGGGVNDVNDSDKVTGGVGIIDDSKVIYFTQVVENQGRQVTLDDPQDDPRSTNVKSLVSFMCI